MAYIRLPLGVRVAMEYEVFGKIVVNVYHITTSDPIVTVKLLDIVDVFESWFGLTMAPAISDDVSLIQITALNLDVPNGEKVTVPVSPAIPGDVALPAVSNNVALVCTFQTAKTGRSFRGRAYIAGLTEDGVTANNVTPASAAFFIAAYVQLLSDLDADSDTLVVASFQSAGVPRAEGVSTRIESISVNTRVDTQRRRLPVV